MQTSESEMPTIGRRGVLGLLAAGAGATALTNAIGNDGPTPGGGDLALGDDAGKRIRGSWNRDEIYWGPQTAPPSSTRENFVWSYNDDLGIMELVTQDSLPVSWTANGFEWVVASDLATAETQRTAEPAFLFGDDGSGGVAAELVAPDQDSTISSNGVEIVMASDLDAARSRHSGAEPALLFGVDGTAEVIVT